MASSAPDHLRTPGSSQTGLVTRESRFPYVDNKVALQAAAYRRKLASLITLHRFGKDLVAPVLAVNNTGGRHEFVTEFVPGEKVENDEAAKEFLGQVSDVFSAAGLSVWQINPQNLTRTPT